MKMIDSRLSISSRGNTDIIDITARVEKEVSKSGLSNGVITLFVSGSTGALTALEYEPNLVKDLRDAFERLAPEDIEYAHSKTWGDHNGHSHIRASLVGPSLQVPFRDKRLRLGTWQQIVFIDFDTRPRKRDLTLQLIGE